MDLREIADETVDLSADDNESSLSFRTMAGMDEEPEWPRLLETWMAEYEPDSPSFKQDVVRAAQADLALRQEERRYDKANCDWIDQQSDVTLWDATQNKSHREMKWRVDQAERTFLRWSGVVERKRRARLRDRIVLERAAAPSKNAKSTEPRQPLPSPEPLPFLQYVDVRVIDGKTQTTYNPANRRTVETLKMLQRQNARVQRQVHFANGLPPEYEWARRDDGTEPRQLDWCISEEEFAVEVELEDRIGQGHVIKSKHLAGPEEDSLD